jgi:hypothetical protein
METKRRIIIQRIDGEFVNLHFQPVKTISAAARFNNIDEYDQFMNGFYGPHDPSLYRPATLKITYELESEDDVNTESRTQESQIAPRD